MKRTLWHGITQLYFDADPASGSGAPADPPADVVTMTQAELDALIKGRVGAAVAQATKKAPSADALAELEALRKEKAASALKDLEAKGQYDAALKSQEESLRKEYEPKLTAAEQKAQTLQTKLEERVIGLSVSDAAGKMNAVNPEQVRRLLAAEFKMNDSFEPLVFGEDGSQRFVAGKAMTPEQRVKEFLDQNPHLVRSTAGPGGGAGGGRTTTTGDTSALVEAQAKVKAAEAEALKTGAPRALAVHAQAVRDLQRLQAGA
jgi:hypothetical protein